MLALLVVLLVVGATVLAITSRPPGPGSPTSPLPVDPFSAHSAPSSTLGAIRPSGDSATVLATISTLNGTTRPGNQPYPGGQYPFNVTVAGNNRIAVVSEYSGNPLLVNATSGVLVAAPVMPGIPTGQRYDPLNGALYVADLSNRSVEEFDPNDGGVLGTIAVPGYPQAIAFDGARPANRGHGPRDDIRVRIRLDRVPSCSSTPRPAPSWPMSPRGRTPWASPSTPSPTRST